MKHPVILGTSNCARGSYVSNPKLMIIQPKDQSEDCGLITGILYSSYAQID